MTAPNDEDTPEDPRVTAALAEARRTVEKVTTLLEAAGWDAIMLSVSRVVQVGPDEFRAPGATATVIDMEGARPVAMQLATVLRKQADILEANSGGEQAPGYIQDQSNYASGLQGWPR